MKRLCYELILILGLISNCSFSIKIFLQKSELKFNKEKSQNDWLDSIDFSRISKLDINSLQVPDLTNEGSVFLEDNAKIIITNNFTLESSDEEKQILCATAKYSIELNQTGWNHLYVKTFEKCPLLIQMFSAGLLEGILSRKEIVNFHENVKYDHQSRVNELESLSEFYKSVDKTIEEKISNRSFFSGLNQTFLSYWAQISLSKSQLYGVFVGYNANTTKKLNLIDFYFINADGQINELLDLMSYQKYSKQIIETQLVMSKTKIIDIDRLLIKTKSKNLKEFWKKSLLNSHCSVFVKPILDPKEKVYKNILVSHSTWDDYNAMIRIFKHYEFDLINEEKLNLKKHSVSFSSYPGCISSTDDFYLINQQLMVTETTLGVLNENAFSKILPKEEYIPDFFRILIANRLSNSAKEWIEWLTLKNTGTYNSQWTILDLSKFQESINKKTLENETIFVLDQFPGQYHYEDITKYLQKNEYWASYNVPFYTETRRESGYSELEENEPTSFSYSNNIRGKIFKKKNPDILTLEDLKHLMLFNQWKTNDSKFLLNNDIDTTSPAEAIASRYDLEDGFSENFGEIDVKVCDFEMMKKHESSIISGPSHQNLPVFKWSTAKRKDLHQGLADEWNFDWYKKL